MCSPAPPEIPAPLPDVDGAVARSERAQAVTAAVAPVAGVSVARRPHVPGTGGEDRATCCIHSSIGIERQRSHAGAVTQPLPHAALVAVAVGVHNSRLAYIVNGVAVPHAFEPSDRRVKARNLLIRLQSRESTAS